MLRPGGLLAVVEVDEALWGLAQPVFPEIEVIHRKAALARRGTGTNRQVVRELPRLLRRAGFTGIVVRPFAVTNDQVPTDSFAAHLGPDQFAPLVADGSLYARRPVGGRARRVEPLPGRGTRTPGSCSSALSSQGMHRAALTTPHGERHESVLEDLLRHLLLHLRADRRQCSPSSARPRSRPRPAMRCCSA